MIWRWIQSLFDSTDFQTPQHAGAWTYSLILISKLANYSLAMAFGILSCLMLWLYFMALRQGHLIVPNQRKLFALLSGLMFWIGAYHLVRAITFALPMYRLMVANNLICNLFAWLMVWILVPGAFELHFLKRSGLGMDPSEHLQLLKESLKGREEERTKIVEKLEGSPLPTQKDLDDHAC